MAITVEDGSIVAGANSYISIADTRTYAAARGATLPVADADVEILLIKAMDYLESLRDRYKGVKVSDVQPCQWPREGVMVDNFDVAADAIPACLVSAQAQAAIDVQTIPLLPVGDGREVVSESVSGAVSVTYSPGSGSAPSPVLSAVMALLNPVLRGGGARSLVVRV
jgi:hypothetical protein